ncbi:MAG: RNA 2',3'-cyclic phosphodiesterase [Chromatiaceae bacterium]
MPERLFFALWPGEEQRSRLLAVLSVLPKHRGRERHPDDLHITLAFLGDLNPKRRTCAERAADAVHGEPFPLLIDRVGYWPRPRILWCGASDRPEPLLRLLGDLNRGLRAWGFVPDRRPFVPHVTLARNARPIDPRPVDPPFVWAVEAFALVGSHPGERPSYQVLRRWPLSHDAAL